MSPPSLLDEEVKAVQIMASAMRQTPQSYTLLHVQCDFLRSKGKLEWAVKLARQAVNCAPSEFVTWEKLTDLYIDMGQYESVRSSAFHFAYAYILTPGRQALLTLNSCPMFTFNGRDAHRNLTPSRVHLPFQRPIGEILPERQKTEDDEVCADVVPDNARSDFPPPG
jgi:hypothetical protein